MYKKILVPIDGSETSRRGLDEAIQLARDNSAKIRLVHVVNTAVVAVEYPGGSLTDEVSDRLRDNGEAVMKGAAGIVSRSGLTAETVVLGTPIDNTGELIVHQATEWPADIIVMGTHGRRGLPRVVLGSNAEYVLRHTCVPVLLVRKS
jgi:nucleotide-binding universal stress UspA family protein